MLATLDLYMTILFAFFGMALGIIVFWLAQEGKERNSQLEANRKKENVDIENGDSHAKVDYPADVNSKTNLDEDKVTNYKDSNPIKKC